MSMLALNARKGEDAGENITANPLVGVSLEKSIKHVNVFSLREILEVSDSQPSIHEPEATETPRVTILNRGDGVSASELLLNTESSARSSRLGNLSGQGSVEQLVKAGTAKGLAICLVEMYRMDWDFVRSFLSTYRDFLKPALLLRILMKRFRYKTKTSSGGGEKTWRRQIQSRVLHVIEFWMSSHLADFLANGEEPLKLLLVFLKKVQQAGIEKFQISEKAEELRQIGEFYRTTPRRNLNMIPCRNTLSKLTEKMQPCLSNKTAITLPIVSEAIAQVLGCGTYEALEWTLLLTSRCFLVPSENTTNATSGTPTKTTTTPTMTSASPPSSPSKLAKKDLGARLPRLLKRPMRVIPMPSNPYAADDGDAAEDELLYRQMLTAEFPPVPLLSLSEPGAEAVAEEASASPAKVTKITRAFKRRGSIVMEMTIQHDKVTSNDSDSSSTSSSLADVRLTETLAEFSKGTSSSAVLGATWRVQQQCPSVASVQLPLVGLDTDMLATDLTIVTRTAFCQIRVTELAGVRWSKPDSELHSPSVTALTAYFNRLTFWVATGVLQEPTVELRCSAIASMLRLSQRLWALGNLHCLMAVLAGLQMNCVSRLKATWAGLSEKHHARFKNLAEVFSPCRNYKRYRSLLETHWLRASQPPADPEAAGLGVPPSRTIIPYFGIMTRDLFFVNESVEKRVEREMPVRGQPGETAVKTLTNVGFITTTGTILGELQRYQSRLLEETKERLAERGESDALGLLDALTGIESLTCIEEEEALYQLSFALEPPNQPRALTLSVDELLPIATIEQPEEAPTREADH